MRIHIHGCINVTVSKQFLHFLGPGTHTKKITGIRMPEHMKMKIFHIRQLLFQSGTDTAYRSPALVSSIRTHADQMDFLKCFRNTLAPGSAIERIMSMILFENMLIIIIFILFSKSLSVSFLLFLCLKKNSLL